MKKQKGVGLALLVAFVALAAMAYFNIIDGRTFTPVNPILRSRARFVAEGGEWSKEKPCR